uniref:Ig-like domain-containing protein n=1 Tax=Sinocyclocheilus anshuiensis TaxID=1608454 RepID=A0A671PBU6_9TELE
WVRDIHSINLFIMKTNKQQEAINKKYVVEGKNVTLSCNYSTTGTVDSLQWYRQYLGAKPEFLLLVNEYSSKSEPDLRLYSKNLRVSDSAVYYCALQPTGNETFGECLWHDRCLKHESKHDNELDIGRRQPMMSQLVRLRVTCKVRYPLLV